MTVLWCDRRHGTYTGNIGDPCPKCPLEVLHPPPTASVTAGEDLAKVRDFSAYISLSIVDSVAKLKRIHQWPHVDYSVVMKDTARFYREDRASAIHVDQGNSGEPIIEQYRLAYGLNVEGIGFTTPSKVSMNEFGRNMMQRAKEKNPPYVLLPTKASRNPLIRELWQQIAEQERLISGAGNTHFAHPEGRHDDLYWTLMLALNAARRYLTEKTWAMRVY